MSSTNYEVKIAAVRMVLVLGSSRQEARVIALKLAGEGFNDADIEECVLVKESELDVARGRADQVSEPL